MALLPNISPAPLSTAVAFFVFNRPDLTKQVFEQIARARPARLLVIADGPRSPEEAVICAEVRTIASQVNWQCQVQTNFAEGNLGCGRRISTGLDWVFANVEEAIILEDDCLPSGSFFSFCDAMLSRYRDDDRVMHISGSNFQFGRRRNSFGYYFSHYQHIWGWATWRRAWRHYDFDMQDWQRLRETGWLREISLSEEEALDWRSRFDQVAAHTLDTWDYQWMYACWKRNALSITPARNLVTNLGFESRATHTRAAAWRTPIANLRRSAIGDITALPDVAANADADRFTHDRVYGYMALSGWRRRARYLVWKAKQAGYRLMRGGEG